MFPPDPRMLAEDQKPSRIHWLVWVIVLVGFAMLIFLAIVPGMRMKKYDGDFERVRRGDTAEKITAIMGEADTSLEALPELERYWGEDVQLHIERDAMKTVLSWEVRFFLRKFVYQVGLDANGRAVAKTRFKR